MVSQWQSSVSLHNWNTLEDHWKATGKPLEDHWKHTGYQQFLFQWHSSVHWGLGSRHTGLPPEDDWLRVRVCLNDCRAQCLSITSTQWSLTYMVSYTYISRPLNSAMWDTLWLSPFHEFILHCMTMASRGTFCIITCRPQMCTDTSNDTGHIRFGHMATELKIRELRVCQLKPCYWDSLKRHWR